jgi:23S rRNA (cytosine1962-C5)-methyltransferase
MNAIVANVDASRWAIGAARANAQASGLAARPVRWLCDDVLSFSRRLVRRGDAFDGIIADPPAFGRAMRGKEWRIERDLPELLRLPVLSGTPAFVLLTSHDRRWPPARLRQAVLSILPRAAAASAASGDGVEFGSMVLSACESERGDLPMGAYARWRSPTVAGPGPGPGALVAR